MTLVEANAGYPYYNIMSQPSEAADAMTPAEPKYVTSHCDGNKDAPQQEKLIAIHHI